jgi:uncharacterized membrane protein
MATKTRVVFGFGSFILLCLLILALVPLYWWGFQALWNFVIVGVFHLPWHLSYWQAAGVSTLLGVIGGALGNSK